MALRDVSRESSPGFGPPWLQGRDVPVGACSGSGSFHSVISVAVAVSSGYFPWMWLFPVDIFHGCGCFLWIFPIDVAVSNPCFQSMFPVAFQCFSPCQRTRELLFLRGRQELESSHWEYPELFVLPTGLTPPPAPVEGPGIPGNGLRTPTMEMIS